MNWLEALVKTHGNRSQYSADYLLKQGLPHRRLEPWRFTDLTALTNLEPLLLKKSGPVVNAQSPLFAPDVVRLTLNGDGGNFVLAQHSAAAPAGLLLNPENPAESEVVDSAWVFQLQNSIVGPSFNLVLGAAESLRLELCLNPTNSAALVNAKMQISLAEGAALELFVNIKSSINSLVLLTLQATLGQGSSLLEAQNLIGAEGAVLLTGAEVNQAATSRYERTALVHGWALARQEPRVVQKEGEAHTFLRDLAIAAENNICDLHSAVRFDGPNGRLEQLQKALVDDAGRSIFNGAVQVPKLAQGTDASQLSRHLLLSDRARVDSKPELAIVADDVRCSHGATISSLATDELFYMQSRGISRQQAVSLLKLGFCQQIVNFLPPLAVSCCSLEAVLKP